MSAPFTYTLVTDWNGLYTKVYCKGVKNGPELVYTRLLLKEDCGP